MTAEDPDRRIDGILPSPSHWCDFPLLHQEARSQPVPQRWRGKGGAVEAAASLIKASARPGGGLWTIFDTFFYFFLLFYLKTKIKKRKKKHNMYAVFDMGSTVCAEYTI